MAVSARVAALACERVRARLSALGRDVPAQTPAAAFLAAAAVQVDAARVLLDAPSPPSPLRINAAMQRLGRAAGLLHDVIVLGGGQPEPGLDHLAAVVDGLCISLDDHDLPTEPS